MMTKNNQLVAVNILLIAVLAPVVIWRTLPAPKAAPLTFIAEEVVVQKGITKAVAPITPNSVPVPLPIIPPKLIKQILPTFPLGSLQAELAGTTILSAYVGTTGQVGQVEVKLSSGSAELDKAAVEAMKGWQFVAATQGGIPLACWYEVPIKFEVK
ncbi:hypothetical protein A2311_02900 [candidate division WOR-1 bacterium RIFOXYB2_FULL_48_7]|uniref:TonB C-terminal domain-containing protein n=1 Tax=candidate division WOR-1 bacterium RIFOXYB2_FULL_48_7 TaxID=1802583 RepID=A0A1F4TW07_UNCSA|nr:MAG: hypothetical protein A2311_02900 [candidate division WOR-1 bacterium RIFOXYB2_FULL_48_7]